MDVREAVKKVLLGFLAITLVVPVFLFVRPQKAEALVSLSECFAARTLARSKAAAEAGLLLAFNVGTADVIVAQLEAESTAGNEFRSCFLNSLTKIIAKTLLHTFTQSIVNWINSGFEVAPSFITNPAGFLSDVADQTIGKVIQDISPLLCAPFKLNIKFALGLNIGLRTRQEVTCRLSDVIANVQGAYDSFVSGTVGSGNLSRWVHIAGTQSNNPYGAYIGVTNIMSASITTATGQQIKLLDWGKGFKSWRSCEKWGPDVKDAQGKVTRKGPCIKEGPIKTPGSIIEGQTTGALATTFRELELASEIDEVVGALINQLLVKAVTGVGGLLGASKGGITDGGQSATDALSTDPTKAVKATDAKTPPGIECRLRYYPATEETSLESGLYVPDDTNPSAANLNNTKGLQVWTDMLGTEMSVELAAIDGDEGRGSGFKKARNKKNGFTLIMRPVAQTWEAYFATVKAGCQNEWNALIDDAAAGGRGVLSGDTEVPPGTPPPPPPPKEENIALNKKAVQSSTLQVSFGGDFVEGREWNYRPGPEYAVNTNKEGSKLYGLAFTGKGQKEWWSVDLATNARSDKPEWNIQEISKINVYAPSVVNLQVNQDRGIYSFSTLYSVQFRVSVTNFDPLASIDEAVSKAVFSETRIVSRAGGNNVVEISVPSDKKGRYVVISQFPQQGWAGDYLGLAEVEVFGKQTSLDTPGNTPAQVVAFSFTATPAQQTFRNPTQWTMGNMFEWGPLFFTPNQAREKITFRARYFAKCPAGVAATACFEGYKKGPEPFTNSFNSLNLLYRIDGESKRKNMIDENGFTADAAVPEDAPGNELFFITDVPLLNTKPIEITLKGSQKCESVSCTGVPFRLVIDALTDTSVTATPVGSVKAEFTVQ